MPLATGPPELRERRVGGIFFLMFVVMGNWVMGVGCCSQGFGIAYCVGRGEVEVEELVDGRVRSLLGSNAGCGKRDLFTVHKPRELNPQRGFSTTSASD